MGQREVMPMWHQGKSFVTKLHYFWDFGHHPHHFSFPHAVHMYFRATQPCAPQASHLKDFGRANTLGTGLVAFAADLW